MDLPRKLYALVPVLALGACLFLVELPLYTLAPGEVRDVAGLVEVGGLATYPPRGKLLLTTVSLGRLNAFELVGAWRDATRQVVPERDVLDRGETDREYRRSSRSQMDGSQIAAVAFAFERLTPYPRRHGRGVLVQNVIAGSAADGVLAPGDRILSIDGQRVRDVGHAGRLIERTGPRPVRLGLAADRGGRTVALARKVLHAGEPPVLGVVLVDSFPYRVRIDSDEVGGPSGGLMYALALMDLLAPGELTSGRTVAGTGTLELGGEVGPVGGIAFKIGAAERAGADVFLLPRENLREARASRPGIPLVAVATIDEALRYLERGSA